MSILSKITNFFKRDTTGTSSNASSASGVSAASYIPSYTLGNNPMAVATVYRCVNVVADSVANLPLKFMRRSGGIFVEDTSSELHYLLNVQPNERMNAIDFWQMVVRYILLKGNAYIYPEYHKTRPQIARLVLLDPTTVSYNYRESLYYINDSVNGVIGYYSEDAIIHLKNYSVDGYNGISTLAYASGTITTAATADKETLNRFANGGTVRGIVGNDRSMVSGYGEYQDDELEKEADDLDDKLNQKGKNIVSVPGQVSFTQMAMSSADMQFLETRKFTVKDLCRFFGVPVAFVYDESSNYKSVEMQNVAFLSTTLNPLLRKIELELHRKLVSPESCCDFKFEFSRSALYATDLEGRTKYQTALLASGIATVNELRTMENMPSIGKIGDTPLVSANLKAVSEFNDVNGYGNE